MTTLTDVNSGSLVRHLKRALQLRRARGNARVVYSLLRRLTALPVIRHCVKLCAIDIWTWSLSNARSPRRIPASFNVRVAGEADVRALIDYYADARRVESRLERGELCVTAWCGDRLGAAMWLSPGPGQSDEDWDELRTVFQYPEKVAWAYDGKGTRLGAWGALMATLPGLLPPRGIEQLATAIDCNNWQSIDAHRSLGFQTDGILCCLRVFGLTIRAYKPSPGRWRPVRARLELARA